YPNWHNYKLQDPRCRNLVNAATERGMTVSIPVRVEDRRQQGWLIDIPDVELSEITDLIRACPKARFIIQNASGVAGSALGRRDNGLPENYAFDIARMSVEFGNEIGNLLAILGEDRLLFGTAMPFHYPGLPLAKLDMLKASSAVKEKIRSGNAERWLGVQAQQ
ncbi:MAG TPA: amidohydrolase family protein, partial [Bryobacteraceae bacterium]|nr:amidohydrolase family protein [Bryobacteraceae bacterium]